MRMLLFTVICGCFFLSECRLIIKLTDKVKTTPEPDHVQSTPYQRVARKISDEDSAGFSKEYVQNTFGQSEEDMQGHNKKGRHTIKPASITNSSRIPRGSRESTNDNGGTTKYETKRAAKVVLIKKPIPKFYELDYDDDFQKGIVRAPLKALDSAEHEDEDFNVDDYDFDVNHDEFIGRGKPLEPRLKKLENKITAELIKHGNEEFKHTLKAPVTKIQPKVITPPKTRQPAKREHPSKRYPKINNKIKIDDYSDEVTTTKSSDATYSNHSADDNAEDSTENKNVKKPLGRSARSLFDKLGEKTALLIANIFPLREFIGTINPANSGEDEEEYHRLV